MRRSNYPRTALAASTRVQRDPAKHPISAPPPPPRKARRIDTSNEGFAARRERRKRSRRRQRRTSGRSGLAGIGFMRMQQTVDMLVAGKLPLKREEKAKA